jgi:serpin B
MQAAPPVDVLLLLLLSCSQEYQSQVERHFKATARPATSVSDINTWVKEATRGLIKELLPAGTPFHLVLTNALYFKGMWEHAFDAGVTRPHPFKLLTGKPVTVQMMDCKFKRQPGGWGRVCCTM